MKSILLLTARVVSLLRGDELAKVIMGRGRGQLTCDKLEERFNC